MDLQFGDGELEIFCRKNPPERMSYPQEACGLRHLAFHVENIDNVVAELNKKGIETEPIRRDLYMNQKMTFFQDPDGLPLEIHESIEKPESGLYSPAFLLIWKYSLRNCLIL